MKIKWENLWKQHKKCPFPFSSCSPWVGAITRHPSFRGGYTKSLLMGCVNEWWHCKSVPWIQWEGGNELPKYMQNFIYISIFLKEYMHGFHWFLKVRCDLKKNNIALRISKFFDTPPIQGICPLPLNLDCLKTASTRRDAVWLPSLS